MGVSLNYCSQNGGNLYRAPYYNGNPNIGPRIMGNLDQYPSYPSITQYCRSQASSTQMFCSRMPEPASPAIILSCYIRYHCYHYASSYVTITSTIPIPITISITITATTTKLSLPLPHYQTSYFLPTIAVITAVTIPRRACQPGWFLASQVTHKFSPPLPSGITDACTKESHADSANSVP